MPYTEGMLFIAIIAALLGAASNALGSVLQHRSSGGLDPGKLLSRDFIKAMVTHRMWLLGTALDILGFLFQAVALYFGTLPLVEPILTVDLIFLFLILYFRYHLRTERREWIGVAIICVGLAALLSTANPTESNTQFHALRWIIVAAAVMATWMFAAAMMSRPKLVNVRTITGAFATGVNFSLTAALTRLTVPLVPQGAGALLGSWEIYAMIASAATAMVIMQSTYASGPLKLSQPIIAIVGPSTSVLLGIILFGTSLRNSPAALAAECISAIVVAAGIVMLTNSQGVLRLDSVVGKT